MMGMQKQVSRKKPFFFIAVLAAVAVTPMVAGCEWAQQSVIKLLWPNPREAYAASLRLTKNPNEKLAQAWLAAAKTAKAELLTLARDRYQEAGYFSAGQISASGFRMPVKRGQEVRIQVVQTARTSEGSGQLFADLYTEDGSGWDHHASLPISGETSTFTAEVDADYLLLLQPELRASIRYTLAWSKGGSLDFPVQGKNRRAIGGVFGDPRDGGRRKHHCVDIFAKRGTPVLAATDGRVRVGDTAIGGKVVWLRDAERGLSYYYAHLDNISVANGTQIKRGSVLGGVGNTGNARGTPPHLHFGIYARLRGPEDPWPYLAPRSQIAEITAQPPGVIRHRVSAQALNIRQAPAANASLLGQFFAGDLITVVANTNGWSRILLADGQHGYVSTRWLKEDELSSR